MSSPLLLECVLSVVPMRREPSDKSEMVSQILFGERGELLEQNEKWYLIRLLHDGYEGWVDKKQLQAVLLPASTQVVLQTSLPSTSAPLFLSPGSLVREEQSVTGHIDLNRLSTQFLNTPYLWGGRSIWGIDCSGFTQIVYRMMGQSIPRDAYQQAELGQTISFIEETQPGDLAFFDNEEGRIIHVGIVLDSQNGRTRIIHASGKVRIDVLDHQGIFNEEIGEYSHKLRIVRRLQG